MRDFRADTVAQLASLSSGELMKIGYSVDLKNDDGESISQGASDNYRNHILVVEDPDELEEERWLF